MLNFLFKNKNFFASVIKKYTLIEGHLIPKAPQKPKNPFVIYYNEVYSTGNKKSFDEAYKQYKNVLSNQQKKQYEEKFEAAKKKIEQQIKNHQQKFEVLYKNSESLFDLLFKQLRETQKDKNIVSLHNQAQSILKNLTQQQKQKLRQQKLNAKQQRFSKFKALHEYKIPNKKFKTSFHIFESQTKQPFSKWTTLSQTQKQVWNKKYQQMVQQYRAKREQFLKKYNLTQEELQELYAKKAKHLPVNKRRGNSKK